jgi:hypothetical protein
MAVIGSDGLSLLVGNGAGSETFTPLKGLTLTDLQISQRNHISSALSSDAWQVSIGTSARRAVIEATAYATDDAATLRLRSLALAGTSGNFKLELSTTETLQLTAVVISYQERIQANSMKRIEFRLESSNAALVA